MLHERLLMHTLTGALKTTADAVELWCPPGEIDAADGYLRHLAAEYNIGLSEQRGRHLGARMAHAIDTAARNGTASVLCGCDCPAHADGLLETPVSLVRAGARWVFRPALDGGYVCVGARAGDDAVFGDLPWGTAPVMELTRQRLRAAGQRWYEVSVVGDVDTPQDLARVPKAWLD
jgi:glycosyltransferase A (GT-A) superfamily protein (DUF2064 family)